MVGLNRFYPLIDCCCFIIADMGGEPDRKEYLGMDCPLDKSVLQIASEQWGERMSLLAKARAVRSATLELDKGRGAKEIDEFIRWFLDREG
jgi:hypothetical protein